MTNKEVRKIQKRLKVLGYKPGVIDGVMGPKTRKAIIAFKVSKGLRSRSHVGPLTKAALFEGRAMPKKEAIASRRYNRNEPTFLRIARSYMWLKEYRGSKHNPKIVEWWIKLGLPFRNDETPWCAGFVGGVLEEAGIRSTRSAAARSYNWKGWGQVLEGPVVGAVVSLWRGKRRGAYGHVGFVVGKDQYGNLMILGGNQGNQVNIRPFSPTRVLSYHYPKGLKLPHAPGFGNLPTVNSNGRVSTNEA